MRNLLLLLAVAVLAACIQMPVKQIKISGKVENPTADKVEVFFYKDFITNQPEKVEVALDENNSFTATLDLAQGNFVYVSMPRRNIMLYLVPGAEISIAFNAEDPNVLPLIDGKKAFESQFMVAYVNEIDRKYNRSIILSHVGNTNPDDFRALMDTAYNEKIAFLEGYKDFRKLNKDFVKSLKTNFLYEKYGLLLEYPMAFAYFNPEAGDLTLPEGYFDFLESENLFGDEFINSRPYFNFVNIFLNRQMQENASAENQGAPYERQFKIASQVFSGKTRDAVLSQTMIYLLNFGSFEAAEQFHAEFKELVTTPEMLSIVDKEYQMVLALSPGKPAPDFTLTDITGNQVSLSDFAGKVVYLDFWASWCGPCMREVPFARELKKRMADHPDLVFLYVSVDTDEAAWRRTVAQMQIEGVHLNVHGFSHLVPTQYNLKGVPTFYLIGRDGKIFDNRPPRPSNPTIDQVLKAALSQQNV